MVTSPSTRTYVHAYTAREDAYEYIDSDEREERRGDRILARRWAAYAYP